MKGKNLDKKEVRERLDIMMAMALIRCAYEKKMISKDVFACAEKNCKRVLKNANMCANIEERTNVGKS